MKLSIKDRIKNIVDTWTDSYAYQIEEKKSNNILSLWTVRFLRPTKEKPVPDAVCHVHFIIDESKPEDDQISWIFENQNLIQSKKISIPVKNIQKLIDRIIKEKRDIRAKHDLKTDYEIDRLENSELGVELNKILKTESESSTKFAEDSPIVYSSDDISLDKLLFNIFDAADEISCGILTHVEVCDLLNATPNIGLNEWDMIHLMTKTLEYEDNDHNIKYLEFVKSAPTTINRLKSKYEYGECEKLKITSTELSLCYGDEIDMTSECLIDDFENIEKEYYNTCTGWLKRNDFEKCLKNRIDRLSYIEISMILQICPENDDGLLQYSTFPNILQSLRIDFINNAIIENNPIALKNHLNEIIQLLYNDKYLTIWDINIILQKTDLICLSRWQIHTILCALKTDNDGQVDIDHFYNAVQKILPRICSVNAIHNDAESIAQEKAINLQKAEAKQLQALADGGVSKNEDIKKEDDSSVDRDILIRHMRELFQLIAQGKSSITTSVFIQTLNNEKLLTLMSDSEIRGFIGEAILDDNKIYWEAHMTKWIPVVYQFRKIVTLKNIENYIKNGTILL
eukprot:GHVL01024727.1.p1 GENE.GHVL01024727.1~~GHVL01024727.1.p1  ORF type:complete len:569 (+),score=168.50 GHVL01024727.1:60-1766(+)